MLEGANLYGSYRTRKFTDVFPDLESFQDFYNSLPTAFKVITSDNITKLYYLLYAQYGNSHIASFDENQFKFKLFMIVYKSGCQWENNMIAQNKIKELTEEEIMKGNKSIYNHSYNPSDVVEDGTSSNVELKTINDQNVNINNKSKMNAYAEWASCFVDITTPFINLFKNLFIKIVNPELPLWYVTEEDE